ncbi:hypothetical protein H7J87_15365 [Mycolicibacterium wolinskyi]|nr:MULTISPECIES: hypothetical protein [Mycolicibacterium]MCV7286706.1 hypothetical protein [Mycolicibacterium wolinskyi]MCV7293686.1 hypothetical protein [Mycolicibacterium goodii]
MYGELDSYQDTHQWSTMQWSGYWLLALLAAFLLLTAIRIAILAAADVIHEDDPTASLALAAGSTLVAVLTAWWSWDRLTALYEHAGPGAAFLIWLGITALSALAFSIAAVTLDLQPRSAKGWIVCIGPLVVLGFVAFVAQLLSKVAAALGVGVGMLLVVGVLGAIAVLSDR